MIQLPSDCTFLPLSNGALLVSPGHAVFCRIPGGDIKDIDLVLRHERSANELSGPLKQSLEAHGFFAPPRPGDRQVPKVQLQLTNACNLSCRYCCTNSLLPRDNELREADFARIIRDIRKHFGKGAGVSFLGGEPFMVPFVTRLAGLALELGLELTIFSNGLPLADNDTLLEEVRALTRNGVMLRISLAGATRESCDNLSGTKRYDSVLTALNKLSEKGGKACVDVMLMPQNARDMALEFYAFKKRLPRDFRVSLGILYLSGRETGEHLFESRQAFERALTDIAFEAGETIEAAKPKSLTFRREGCDCAMGRNLNVRSDGSLFPCFKMEEVIGHIENLSLGDALEKIRNSPHPASGLQTCRACALNTLCGGGCRSDNFLYSGTGEPLCGPWRVRVISELLAENCTGVVHWSVPHLYVEAKRRGIDVPDALPKIGISRHCIE